MSLFDDLDYKELERILEPVERMFKGYDLIKLRRTPEYDRIEMWNRIEESRRRYEEGFLPKLADDLARSVTSRITLAKLLLAAAADANGEGSHITREFSREELELVEDFERLGVFDILSVRDAIDKIKRKEGGIYELIVEYYEKQYSNLDEILDSPDILRDLKVAFMERYLKRQWKIEEILSVAIRERLIDPSELRKDIEKTVLDRVKESERRREEIIRESEERIAELESRLEDLESVEAEKLSLETKLSQLEADMIREELEKESLLKRLRSLESDRDNLRRRYTEMRGLLDEKMREIGAEREELERQREELERELDRYRKEMDEEKQRIIENELKEIHKLKDELKAKENAIMEEKREVELNKNEITEKLQKITEAISGKPIRIVTREDAKLYELNYIARFDAKMHRFPLRMYNPLEQRSYTITSWKNHQRSDSREEILTDDLARNAKIEAENPLNLRSTYTVERRSFRIIGERKKRIVIEAISYNHLKSYVEYGFDTVRATLSEFLMLLSRSIERAEMGKYLHVIGIASPTGWDERVISEIRSSEFAHNYVSRYVSVCLIDSVTGDVYYNDADDRIAGYIDLFKPEFERERVERIKNEIRRRMELKDYAVLEDILSETGEERAIVNKAFYDLAGAGEGRTRYIKGIGMVIELRGQ